MMESSSLSLISVPVYGEIIETLNRDDDIECTVNEN